MYMFSLNICESLSVPNFLVSNRNEFNSPFIVFNRMLKDWNNFANDSEIEFDVMVWSSEFTSFISKHTNAIIEYYGIFIIILKIDF